ncbi:hypothetical protein L798_06972 [Zootermopsis nevadensis]|uniref:Uncharacterized protein n=1 Tax=Zootermopsis nevadensis TaxID=136037 RepID=A0A067R4Q4_ZOONE|nr:hypothetical protein L798_06972 [Zootermopsis nevadensis]
MVLTTMSTGYHDTKVEEQRKKTWICGYSTNPATHMKTDILLPTR